MTSGDKTTLREGEGGPGITHSVGLSTSIVSIASLSVSPESKASSFTVVLGEARMTKSFGWTSV